MPPLKLKYFYLAGDSDVEVQKNGLPACLTKSFESERINHKKSSVFCALSGFSEDEAYDSALPLLLSVFQSITLPRPRFTLSSVNMLSCNGENPFRTNESVSSEKLTGDNSLKYLLTHTNRQLSLPVHLHLVPVNVFKGIYLLILLYIYTHSLSRKLF